MSRHTTATAAIAGILFLAANLSAATICYYGADLDQEFAKDTAKDIGEGFKKNGATTYVGTDIGSGEIFNNMKDGAGNCYDPATGKFECNGGVLFVYISGHGTPSADGKDTVIANRTKGPNTTLSALTTSIAAAIPECCTVIFAFDACAADSWYNEFITPATGDVNPKNPFKNVNWAVLAPAIVNGRCIGSPVADAIKKAFGKERKVSEYIKFMSEQPGVLADGITDQNHDYALALLVDIPEPSSLAVLALALSGLAVWRNRRRLK